MKKITLPIKGMHCSACETLIEQEVKKIDGVQKAKARFRKNQLLVMAEENVTEASVEEAVKTAGYMMENGDEPLLTTDKRIYFDLFVSFVLILVLFIIFKAIGINDLAARVGSPSSLVVVGLIGLTAGFSTCMALVGGLLIGISAKHAEKHLDSTPFQKFRLHIYFNVGRIISYTVLGGFIGLIGPVLQPSQRLLGFLILFVGIVMLFLGLQLTEISPRLNSFKITLPKGLAKILGIYNKGEKEYSHRNSFILGALTFFLPCGFTQAMQLYAISRGNFVSGALIMGVFALGTTPGLLSIGGITSALKGSLARKAFKFVGLVVVFFALFNLSNGYNLSGLKQFIAKANKSQSQNISATIDSDGKTQVFEATYASGKNIQPKNFKVKVGQPVRIEIMAETDGVGCMGSVMIPGLVDRPQFFQKGEKVILGFTPKETGSYDMTCAMGIRSGEIRVVN